MTATWVIAIALALAHILAPMVFVARQKFEPGASSLTGGIAVAYVFLHLMPEIEIHHQHIGSGIYVLALLGFLIYQGTEYFVENRRTPQSTPRHGLRLGSAVAYNILVLYTIGEQLPETTTMSVVFALGLAAHLVAMDNGLEEQSGARFRNLGRPTLVLAVVIGAALAVWTELPELIVDIATAVLAGGMMFVVFREELPAHGAGRFPWFALGVGLVLAIWWSVA